MVATVATNDKNDEEISKGNRNIRTNTGYYRYRVLLGMGGKFWHVALLCGSAVVARILPL